jgi:hypothetical protein
MVPIVREGTNVTFKKVLRREVEVVAVMQNSTDYVIFVREVHTVKVIVGYLTTQMGITKIDHLKTPPKEHCGWTRGTIGYPIILN